MGKINPKKEYAKTLFINSDFTGKEISELISVSEKSISNWRIEGKWDEAKAMATTTPEKLITYLFEQINLIKECAVDTEGKKRPLCASEVDSLSKLASSIQKMRGNVSPQIVMQCLNGFVNYLEKTNLDLAKEIVDYVAEYYSNYKSEKI